jgi:hypothetical protein
MKRLLGIAWAAAAFMSGILCVAQGTALPSSQTGPAPQPSAVFTHYNFANPIAEPNSSSGSGASASSTFAAPAPVHISPVFSRSFFLLNSLQLGMAALDVEMTQRCVADNRCKEGNPLMPSTRNGQLGVSVGIAFYAVGTSYWLKKHHSRVWWIVPAAGIAVHSAGVASGLAHQ